MAAYVVSSGETRLVSEVLPAWIFDEKVILSDESGNCFAAMDDLLSGPQLYEFLSQLKPIPFYRYMVRYLLARYPELCDESPEVAAVPEADRAGALARAVYAEIRAGRKSKPLQNRLLQKVLMSFQENGCAAGEGAVHGSLTDSGLHWSYARLRDMLFCDSIGERQFFMLALGLHMAVADTTAFLQKALLRQPLRDLIPEEGFLRICLETEIAHRYALFQALWEPWAKREDARTHAKKADPDGEKTRERSRRKLADPVEVQRALEALQKQCNAQHPVDFAENVALGQYLDLAEAFDFTKLPENQAFLNALKKIQAKYRKREARCELQKHASLPVGTVTVEYRQGSQFTIPAGTVFCDGEGNPVAESLQEVSTVASGAAREIEIEVFSRHPIAEREKPVEKQSRFRCRLPADAPAAYEAQRTVCQRLVLVNKSRIKGGGVEDAGRRYYLRGTLIGRVPDGVAFPAGTEFYCEDEDPPRVFINREAISFYNLEVPVQALPHQAAEDWPTAISRNTIVTAQLPAETLDCIRGITHPRLTARIRTDKNASLLMEYFYGPMPAEDYVYDMCEDVQGHLADYPRLLAPVLRGMRLSDARISQIKKTGYPSVRRHELLTAIFLQQAVTRYKDVAYAYDGTHGDKNTILVDGQAQGLDLQRTADERLSAAGFSKMYLPNPYDSLLMYLSLYLDPAEVYRWLWGILRGTKEQEGMTV